MLLLDLDETLVKTFSEDLDKGFIKGIGEVKPIKFDIEGDPYSTFLRPDIELLHGVNFGIFTAGTRDYAQAIAKIFKEQLGFNVGRVKHRDHTNPSYPKSMKHGLLFDESEGIAGDKISKLPNFKWIKAAPFDTLKYDKKGYPIMVVEEKKGASLYECLMVANHMGYI